MPPLALKNYSIHKFNTKHSKFQEDLVAIEEPLEIVLIHNANSAVLETPFTLTMRSPGDDHDLATGLLFNEGVIQDINDIEHIRYCTSVIDENKYNKLKITLKPNIKVDIEALKRTFLSNSSCGICGKQMLDEICNSITLINFSKKIALSTLYKLPDSLQKHQLVFKHTGGIHACGLFTSDGSLISIKEDIGRHNALDKLIGGQFSKKEKFNNTVVVLSGRIGYEMAQKTAKAGIPVLIAIGAPTSLAIDIANEAGICLIGFAKNNSLNIYTHSEYIDFDK